MEIKYNTTAKFYVKVKREGMWTAPRYADTIEQALTLVYNDNPTIIVNRETGRIIYLNAAASAAGLKMDQLA